VREKKKEKKRKRRSTYPPFFEHKKKKRWWGKKALHILTKNDYSPSLKKEKRFKEHVRKKKKAIFNPNLLPLFFSCFFFGEKSNLIN